MGLFRKKPEERAFTTDDPLLKALISPDEITEEMALNVPAIAGCLELIGNTIATLPINLYQDNNGEVKQIKNDVRVRLLNDDTGDTLDGYQWKKAFINDYFLYGSAFAYLNKRYNTVKSINYVDRVNIGFMQNFDPIFKSYQIVINGKVYYPFEFLKIIRNTKDGFTGKGIIQGNSLIISVAYNSLILEKMLVKTGGNKKGFLKSESKLDDNALRTLKDAWKNLYGNNTENIMVLNKGLDFAESSNSSVEMQLNEQKRTNSIEMCKLFDMPPSMLDGKATADEYENFVKSCILPIIKAITTALNKDLLLEREKGSFYFALDTTELLKGDMLKRYQAYGVAIDKGFMQIDEVRYKEDLKPLGLPFIKLGLQDVLYNPTTKEIYTPNTNKTSNIENPKKEVVEDESGNQEQPGDN